MFGDAPQILTKNFVIGYLLPMGIFWIFAALLLAVLGHEVPALLRFDPNTKIEDATGFLLISISGAIVLLGFNQNLLRLLEGYPVAKKQWATKRQRRNFKNKKGRAEKLLRRLIDSTEPTLPRDQQDLLNQLMYELSIDFPDEEHLVLPTRFGNRIRAFEVYSRVMYGLDSIPGWTRLFAVLPDSVKDQVNHARSQVDLWSNLFALSILFVATSLVLGVPVAFNWYNTPNFEWSYWFLLVPVAAAAAAYGSYIMACEAILVWGQWIKSAFDLYLPKLYNELRLPEPDANSSARAYWKRFSDAITWRLPEQMPDRKIKMPEEQNTRENKAAQ